MDIDGVPAATAIRLILEAATGLDDAKIELEADDPHPQDVCAPVRVIVAGRRRLTSAEHRQITTERERDARQRAWNAAFPG